MDYIAEKDIRKDDTVIVYKAGDIIPAVLRVVESKRVSEEKLDIPTNCPSCESDLLHFEDEVALRCINPRCPAQIMEGLIHFASRDAMNITGLGPSIVEKLFAENLVRDVADIYRLKEEDFLLLEGVKEKSASKLYQAIQASKETQLRNYCLVWEFAMSEARPVSFYFNIFTRLKIWLRQIQRKWLVLKVWVV